MTKRELEAALAEAERVRDLWCGEYVRARDALKALERQFDEIQLRLLSEASGFKARAALEGQ
jgi:hypothetical protein